MTPDELWKKHLHNDMYITKAGFLAAIAEYGELVKAEAVKVCREQMIRADSRHNHGVFAGAAAIEKMKLP